MYSMFINLLTPTESCCGMHATEPAQCKCHQSGRSVAFQPKIHHNKMTYSIRTDIKAFSGKYFLVYPEYFCFVFFFVETQGGESQKQPLSVSFRLL